MRETKFMAKKTTCAFRFSARKIGLMVVYLIM